MKTIAMYKLTILTFIFTIANVSNSEWSPKVALPEKLIVGYAGYPRCNEKLIQSAKNGVNVMIWFAIDLLHNYTTGQPYINGGPDPDCVYETAKMLKELQLETIHLISIGGWGAPHPDTSSTAEQYFAEWKRWNNEVIRKSDFSGYDGIDWDIEGTDVVSNERNEFKVTTLELMGRLSQLFKQDGYIVSMAPAESYMDPTSSLFDGSLRHTYSEWDYIVPEFTYRGHNPYSYLISRYATTAVGYNENNVEIKVATFDFVTIQLYETYSHCLYNTSILGQPASEYLRNIVQKFETGWYVDFSSAPEFSWTSRMVQVPPTKLVIGLANGWANSSKVLLLNSSEVALGYRYLNEMGLAPKGFGFWNIYQEGQIISSGEEMWLAKDMDNILHIRTPSENSSANFGLGFMLLIMCSVIITII